MYCTVVWKRLSLPWSLANSEILGVCRCFWRLTAEECVNLCLCADHFDDFDALRRFHWKETTNFLLLQSLSRCFILLSSVWMFKKSPPHTISKNGEADISAKPTFRLVKFDMFCRDWLGRCDAGNCRCKEHLETSNFQGRARLRGKPKSCVFRWEFSVTLGESYKIDLTNNPDLCMNLNHVNLWFWLVCFFWKDLWTWLWGYVWHICGFVFGSSCNQCFWRRDVITDIDWRHITKAECNKV